MGVSVAVMDITQAKRAEETRRESETHLRHMMEFSSQILLILDSKGRALAVRHCWIEVTGMNDEQWRGLGWINAVHPKGLPAVWGCLASILRNRSTYGREVPHPKVRGGPLEKSACAKFSQLRRRWQDCVLVWVSGDGGGCYVGSQRMIGIFDSTTLHKH